MSDLDNVEGSQSLTPEEKQLHYKQDYEESFQLFQKAFHEYNQPNQEFHKKQMFKKVMDEALQVMNETACVAISKSKQVKESEIQVDYKAYIKDPTDENKQKVINDIADLK